jgi:hypothetical protein
LVSDSDRFGDDFTDDDCFIFPAFYYHHSFVIVMEMTNSHGILIPLMASAFFG